MFLNRFIADAIFELLHFFSFNFFSYTFFPKLCILANNVVIYWYLLRIV